MCNKRPSSRGNAFPERGILYVSCAEPKIIAKMRQALQQAGVQTCDGFTGVLAINTVISAAAAWQCALSETLSADEIATVKCRLMPQGVRPTCADLMQSIELSSLLAWLEGRWLGEMMAAGGLFSVFQPIVYTRQPSRVFAYESLIRGRLSSGDVVSPDRMFRAARNIGLSAELDCAARISAIRCAATKAIADRIFVNINVNSIFDPKRCLASTIAAVESSGLRPEQLVFEVVETEEIANQQSLFQVLEIFRDRGMGVALDDVGDGYASLNLLARVRPDFMKLDMGLIRNVHLDRYKDRVAAKLLELAHDLDVPTIVEGVECQGEWLWARRHGADFVQGYLFATPAEQPPIPNEMVEVVDSAPPALAALSR